LIGEIRTMMKAGAIDSATYLPMLIEGMAERFEGMMDKQSKTWGGLYSTFQDNMMLMFKDVGRPFFDLSKIRLSNLVSFMDSPRYQQFLPQMTRIVKSVSEFADKKISNALSWLTGPSAYNFAQQMREVAGEVMRIARVGEARAMAFLRSENVQAAAHWTGQTAIWLTRMAGLGFDNVMDFDGRRDQKCDFRRRANNTAKMASATKAKMTIVTSGKDEGCSGTSKTKSGA
jgi:hypothetical protein